MELTKRSHRTPSRLIHPDVVDFITATRSELPWVKRCVDIDDEMWAFADQDTKDALIYGIKSGDIWLNKIKHDPNTGERIYGNVCLEVYLPSRGTCLLQHVNLGACTLDNLQEAFVSGMSELCDLHGRTGVGESGEYLTPEVDRQVGLECSVLPTSSEDTTSATKTSVKHLERLTLVTPPVMKRGWQPLRWTERF